MNRFDEQLRKKLETEKVDLNPAHAEQFSQLLHQRNLKRRRTVFWWLWGIVLIAATGIFVYNFSGSGEHPEGNASLSKSISRTGTASSDPRGIDADHTSKSESPGNAGQHQNQYSRPEISPPGKAGDANRTAIKIDKVHARTQPDEHFQNAKIASTAKASGGQGTPVAWEGESKKIKDPNFYEAGNEQGVLEMNEKAEPIVRDKAASGRELAREVLKISSSRPAFPKIEPTGGYDHAVPVSVQPSLTRPAKNWHLGITAGYGRPPATGLPKKAAHMIHAGGFMQRKWSRKWSVGMEAGFAYQRGGIEFEKSSAVTQYGFGLRSTINTLQLRETFAAYASVFGQHHMGRHLLEGSISARYLYGAKGHISRFVEDDLTGVKEELLPNVWIETEGLRKLSFGAGLGYGYRIFPFMTVLMRVNIPISGFTGNRNQFYLNQDYYIDSKRQKLIPEITLRYRLFRI